MWSNNLDWANELIVSTLVLIMTSIVTFIAARRFSGAEAKLFLLSFAFHICSGLAIASIIWFYYGGDAVMYYDFATTYSRELRDNFSYVAPDLLRMALHQKTQYLYIKFDGTATGTMQAISAWLMLLLNDSFYAPCVLFGATNFWSKAMIYSVVKRYFPAKYHTRMMVALLFMPSVAFWASGLLKESVAMSAFGLLFVGAQRLNERAYVRGVLWLAVGAFIVSLVKAYILFPLTISYGVAIYWMRSLRLYGQVKILRRPVQLVLIAVAVLGALLLLGELFPKYSLTQVGEEVAELQQYGQRRAGVSSNYVIGDTQKRSLAQQSLYMPIGLLFALFRPLPFDIRNAAILLNVFEMMVLLVLWVQMFSRRSWRKSVALVVGHPLLMFSVVFVLIFGAIVGISTTNIGTLSRYRIPMMPFYGLLLAVLSAKLDSDRGARGPSAGSTPAAGPPPTATSGPMHLPRQPQRQRRFRR